MLEIRLQLQLTTLASSSLWQPKKTSELSHVICRLGQTLSRAGRRTTRMEYSVRARFIQFTERQGNNCTEAMKCRLYSCLSTTRPSSQKSSSSFWSCSPSWFLQKVVLLFPLLHPRGQQHQ